MNPLDLIPAQYRLLVELALILVLSVTLIGLWEYHNHVVYQEGDANGAARVQRDWDSDKIARAKASLDEAQHNGKETLRRLQAQQENQRAQNQEAALARADAERNAHERDELRQQSADAARHWRDALGDSATRADVEAAGTAIVLLTDLLGKSRDRAGQLAAFADTSRAAGLKCERDYDSLGQ